MYVPASHEPLGSTPPSHAAYADYQNGQRPVRAQAQHHDFAIQVGAGAQGGDRSQERGGEGETEAYLLWYARPCLLKSPSVSVQANHQARC